MSEWKPIDDGAPRDGSVFIGCDLEHPSFGSWPMCRRVKWEVVNDEWMMRDLGAWWHFGGIHFPDSEGNGGGPAPETALAADDFNTSVRYGWQPLPATQSDDIQKVIP